MTVPEAAGDAPYYFEFSTGYLYTDEACLAAIESRKSPPNLYQLRAAGRLVVASETVVERVEDTGTDTDVSNIQPLGKILLDQQITIKTDQYERLDVDSWHDTEPYITSGRWLLSVTNQFTSRSERLHQRVIRKAYLMGLFPSNDRISNPNRFGSITRYNRALGTKPSTHRRGEYNHWTRRQIGDYVERTFVNRPQGMQMNVALSNRAHADEGPSIEVIVRLAGRPSVLLAERDYYMGGWDYQQHIDWGVKVKRANDGRRIVDSLLGTLSRRKRGPSEASVRKFFGKITIFNSIVQKEYEQDLAHQDAMRQDKLNEIYESIEEGSLPLALLDNIHSEDHLMAVAAKYKVLQNLVPHLEEKYKRQNAIIQRPDWFVRAVQRADPHITEAEIEITADTLGVFDDIWPPDKSYMDYLRVD